MPHKWKFFLEGTPQNHPTAASPLTSKSSAKARVFSSAPSSHGFTMLRWMGKLFFGITITTFFRINFFAFPDLFCIFFFGYRIAVDNPKVVWSIGWWVHDLPQLLVWSHCARKNLVWPSCRWSFPLDFGPKSITAQAKSSKKTHLFFFGVEVQTLTALTSQVWHLQLSVIFIAVCPISGRRRERFLSETSRASNPNSSCRVLVDFLEVSHFHKGKLWFFS